MFMAWGWTQYTHPQLTDCVVGGPPSESDGLLMVLVVHWDDGIDWRENNSFRHVTQWDESDSPV